MGFREYEEEEKRKAIELVKGLKVLKHHKANTEEELQVEVVSCHIYDPNGYVLPIYVSVINGKLTISGDYNSFTFSGNRDLRSYATMGFHYFFEKFDGIASNYEMVFDYDLFHEEMEQRINDRIQEKSEDQEELEEYLQSLSSIYGLEIDEQNLCVLELNLGDLESTCETWVYEYADTIFGEDYCHEIRVPSSRRYIVWQIVKRLGEILPQEQAEKPTLVIECEEKLRRLISLDCSVIQKIKNPTEEMSSLALEYVKDQTPGMRLAAVTKNGHALQYVKEQTPEICLAAVKQYGRALEYVKVQTPEICLAAVEENGMALQHVKKQTPEICLAAVQQNGDALKYVKEQTPEICLAAVKERGWALQYVKEQTHEICLAAVKENAWALEYVKDQGVGICLAAVKRNGMTLLYVKEQTPEICLAAVKQNKRVIQLIKDEKVKAQVSAELRGEKWNTVKF